MVKACLVCYIYKILHVASGRLYVGQTETPRRRWYDHKRASTVGKLCTPLYFAMRKYGNDAFEFSVLEECAAADVNSRETFWITELKTHDRRYGYNCGFGGNNGNNSKDPEVRRKISATKTGVSAGPCSPERAENIRKAKLAKGYRHTQATRKRISQNRKVTQLTPEWRQNIRAGLLKTVVYKLSDSQVTEILQLFASGRSKLSLAKEFGVHHKTIGRVCNGTYTQKQDMAGVYQS